MKIYLDCIPCFVRQTLDAVRMTTDDVQLQQNIMQQVLIMLAETDHSSSPPAVAREIHRKIRASVNNTDPYKKKKQYYNEFALNLVPKFRKLITDSKNPFETAIRFAIAGNIIDLGVKSALETSEVENVINNALTDFFDNSDIGEFESALKNAQDILYLADNAGEIFFDRFLIEQIGPHKVTLAVKGSPVINDATIEDAKAAALTDIVKVIDNGDDAPGTVLKNCSPEFQKHFEEADLIIAKGQGNYETLSDVNKSIFFILKVKCPVVAADIGCPVGKMILQKQKKKGMHHEKSRNNSLSAD